MFGIEIGFYFLGFITCLFLIAIIFEVNDKAKENKKRMKRNYRNELARQKEEQEELLNEIKDEIDIDVKVY